MADLPERLCSGMGELSGGGSILPRRSSPRRREEAVPGCPALVRDLSALGSWGRGLCAGNWTRTAVS